MDARERLERWTTATLEGVLGDLASTQGGRNAALRDASIRVGALVRYRLVDEGDAARRLLEAAESNGYTRKDGVRTATGVIKRGLRYGLEEATIPDEIIALIRDELASPSSPPDLSPPPAPVAGRPPPPADEVRALWDAAPSVVEDEHVATYLRGRGIDPSPVADEDLARALPQSTLPRWACGPDGRWGRTGHRLLVPLYDVGGELRSMLARLTRPATDERKSLAPAGYARRELVMACPVARQILRSGELRVRRLVVCEGETDYLLAASKRSDSDEHAPALIGIVSGSWSADLAWRIPDGATLVIATDDDTEGEKYFAEILGSRDWRGVRLARWRATDAS